MVGVLSSDTDLPVADVRIRLLGQSAHGKESRYPRDRGNPEGITGEKDETGCRRRRSEERLRAHNSSEEGRTGNAKGRAAGSAQASER